MKKTTISKDAKIAFIGLGNMGLPMATNLHRQYANAHVYDLVAAARKRATKASLSVGKSPAATVADAEVIVTMLPSGEHVGDFYAGENGVLDAVKKGALLVDCSTISVEEVKTMAAAAKKRGAVFMDAPVSGGINGAQAATLSFLVGGDKRHFARVLPILRAMGDNIFHAGAAGAGQAAKVCNNMMLSIQMVGVCEALLLGQKMGLSGVALSEIMKKCSGGNWVLEKYNPLPGVMKDAPAASNYRRGFMVDLMVKDTDLAMQAAKSVGAATPLGALAHQLYRLHQRHGHGATDFSGILNLLK